MIVHRFGDAIARTVPLLLCGFLAFSSTARATPPTLDESDRANWAGMMRRVAAIEEFLTDVAGGTRASTDDRCLSALAQEVRDLVRDGNNIGVLIGLSARMAHPLDQFTVEDQVEKALKVEVANARASQQVLTSLAAGDCATNAFRALRAKLQNANTSIATTQPGAR